MSENKIGALLIAVCVAIAGYLIMSINSDRLEQENNAFAKECNDRGGRAEFSYAARQCIGAAKAASNNTTKKDEA